MTTKQKSHIQVVIENEQPVTTSLNVAENFNKDHYRVLRAIDDLKENLKGVSQKWRDLFWEDTYTHPQNKQEYRLIWMTRDGFNLIAMGFTGKEAIKYKLAYIQRFNEMEQQLQNQLPGTYKEALLQLVEQVEEKERLEEQNQVQSQLIAEYEPIVTYYDTILNSKDTVTVSQVAADYGLSAIELNKILHDEGVQRKVNGQWILYKQHMQNGYTKSQTHVITLADGREKTVMNTRWTQKGRLLIHQILEDRGINALMDKEM